MSTQCKLVFASSSGFRNVFKVKYLEDGCTGDGMLGWLIFTDGSCVDGRVETAFVLYVVERKLPAMAFRLTDHCSVFQAELFIIRMALLWAEESLPD